jgi:hypothetical protein
MWSTIAAWAAVLALCAISLWIRRRRQRQNPFTTRSATIANPPKMAAVRNADALVYVNADGSVRELTATEKTYVETEFSPLDGARPFIKSRYSDRTARGVQGYLPRAEVPGRVSIDPAPAQDTSRPQTAQAAAESLSELIRNYRRS